MQYVVFKKRYMRCTVGSAAKPPEAGGGGVSSIFVLKVTVSQSTVGLIFILSIHIKPF